MIRKVFSLLPIVLMSFGIAKAQLPCTTSEMNAKYAQDHPEIAKYEQQLKAFIEEGMKSVNAARSKGTAFGEDDTLHIPVVVHIVHDYAGTDYIPDEDVYTLIDQINEVFMGQNADRNTVIDPFKPYVGNPKIMFHLATKDPKGKPTTGITRRQSYLTDGGDDQAKFDQWDPASYLNIWTIRRIGRGISNGVVAAYAVFPSSAAAIPYTDGIIGSVSSLLSNKTIPHEIGHILSLFHTWGNTQVATDCSGDDEVDDTPPTSGHFGNGSPFGATASGSCNNASLYDTSCTNNITSLSKILLDSTLSPKSDSDPKSIDYVPRTKVYLESLDIYPTKIGEEFEIIHSKLNGGVFTNIDTLTTKRVSLGFPAIGSKVISSSLDSPLNRSTMQISALESFMLDSFTIYPSVAGQPFTIELTKFNGNPIATYSGVTTTGAQVVPFMAYVPKGTYNNLRVTVNPGLMSDTITNAMKKDFETNYALSTGGVQIVYPFDTTGASSDTASSAYKGRYMYFYNIHVRHGGITTTDSGVQKVVLGSWDAVPDSTYRITLTKNPGLLNDSVGSNPTYVRSVTCILDIKNETQNERYNSMYNLNVRYGYIKNCIDYPDTVNTENIMDYANCPKMFTELQVKRMRTTLASPVGNRNNLVSETTHIRTGILNTTTGKYYTNTTMPVLVPVPDVSMERTGGERTFFLCNTKDFKFKQRSWRAPVSQVKWEFSNNARFPSVVQSGGTLNINQINSFAEPGWVDVKLTASGTAGDSTLVLDDFVYAADGNNSINPLNGFYMDFEKEDTNNPIDQWPTFNYYKNEQRWTVMDNVGFTGNGCISYRTYDKRQGSEIYNGTPNGDYDDFFTPAFDLSGMNGICRLNFMSSGAFRTYDSKLMMDKLEIAYSTDCGESWTEMAELQKGDIGNKGVVGIEYSPLYNGDWKLQSFDIPVKGAPKVFFRFRYRPGGDSISNTVIATRMIPGTGNHFYIDRINISPFPLGVNTLLDGDKKVALAPNPTNGSSQLVIKSTSTETANVVVTDITGKVVYTTSQQLNGNITTIDIPATAIKVQGVYMVHVQAGADKYTEKLVSY